MYKVKVFRFEVSNPSSYSKEEDANSDWFKKARNRLVSESTIEKTINDFIHDFVNDGKSVQISVNTIDIQYHNNAKGNTIHLVYTIVYQV